MYFILWTLLRAITKFFWLNSQAYRSKYFGDGIYRTWSPSSQNIEFSSIGAQSTGIQHVQRVVLSQAPTNFRTFPSPHEDISFPQTHYSFPYMWGSISYENSIDLWITFICLSVSLSFFLSVIYYYHHPSTHSIDSGSLGTSNVSHNETFPLFFTRVFQMYPMIVNITTSSLFMVK